MKIWEVDYEGSKIRVENSWYKGERLLVNDKLQDEQNGPGSRARLYGHILDASGNKLKIKVSLGGWWTINCRIFVNDSLILKDQKSI